MVQHLSVAQGPSLQGREGAQGPQGSLVQRTPAAARRPCPLRPKMLAWRDRVRPGKAMKPPFEALNLPRQPRSTAPFSRPRTAGLAPSAPSQRPGTAGLTSRASGQYQCLQTLHSGPRAASYAVPALLLRPPGRRKGECGPDREGSALLQLCQLAVESRAIQWLHSPYKLQQALISYSFAQLDPTDPAPGPDRSQVSEKVCPRPAHSTTGPRARPTTLRMLSGARPEPCKVPGRRARPREAAAALTPPPL